jgi:hypothetical protein
MEGETNEQMDKNMKKKNMISMESFVIFYFVKNV